MKSHELFRAAALALGVLTMGSVVGAGGGCGGVIEEPGGGAIAPAAAGGGSAESASDALRRARRRATVTNTSTTTTGASGGGSTAGAPPAAPAVDPATAIAAAQDADGRAIPQAAGADGSCPAVVQAIGFWSCPPLDLNATCAYTAGGVVHDCTCTPVSGEGQLPSWLCN